MSWQRYLLLVVGLGVWPSCAHRSVPVTPIQAQHPPVAAPVLAVAPPAAPCVPQPWLATLRVRSPKQLYQELGPQFRPFVQWHNVPLTEISSPVAMAIWGANNQWLSSFFVAADDNKSWLPAWKEKLRSHDAPFVQTRLLGDDLMALSMGPEEACQVATSGAAVHEQYQAPSPNEVEVTVNVPQAWAQYKDFWQKMTAASKNDDAHNLPSDLPSLLLQGVKLLGQSLPALLPELDTFTAGSRLANDQYAEFSALLHRRSSDTVPAVPAVTDAFPTNPAWAQEVPPGQVRFTYSTGDWQRSSKVVWAVLEKLAPGPDFLQPLEVLSEAISKNNNHGHLVASATAASTGLQASLVLHFETPAAATEFVGAVAKSTEMQNTGPVHEVRKKTLGEDLHIVRRRARSKGMIVDRYVAERRDASRTDSKRVEYPYAYQVARQGNVVLLSWDATAQAATKRMRELVQAQKPTKGKKGKSAKQFPPLQSAQAFGPGGSLYADIHIPLPFKASLTLMVSHKQEPEGSTYRFWVPRALLGVYGVLAPLVPSLAPASPPQTTP